MKNYFKNKKSIIEPLPLVACLPNYEEITGGPMVRNLKKRFYLRSSNELKLESEKHNRLTLIRI
jgi:hypothetical protein